MTKAKNTKRALLASVLSMMLCIAMLVGSTFAWFTDNVTSGMNKIVAGNLDVEVTHTNKFVKNQPLQDAGDLFPIALWEPGVVSYETFTITNKGTLAFDYEFNFKANDFNNVVLADGTETELSLRDVIQIGVIEGAVAESTTRQQLIDAVKTAKEIEGSAARNFAAFKDFKHTDYMQANEKDGKPAQSEKTFTVVAYWEPNVKNDDDYNINNGKTVDKLNDGEKQLYINMVVDVQAKQRAYESDSFDNGYDEALKYPITIANGLYYDGEDTYYVTNANGLTAMTDKINEVAEYEAHIFKGKTVKLTRNIDLGGVEWLPIGGFGLTSKQFDGTFDGQGHTVSNFKITKKNIDREGKNRSSHGLFGNVSGTIKNLTVKDVTVDLKDAANGNPVAALVGRLNGGLIENCHVVDSNLTTNDWQIGGLVGQNNAGNIKGCSVVNTTITGMSAVGALVGIRLSVGESTIENCSVKDCTIVQNDSYDGIYDEMFGVVLGAVYKDATINVTACTIEGTTIKGTASSVVCGYTEAGATVNIMN